MKIVRIKSTKSKNTARTLPRMARAPNPKKAAAKRLTPVPMTFRAMVHDALGGLDEARRAYDDQRVYEFRGRNDLAHYEDIRFHESLQRVHGWLVELDLQMPEVQP